MCVFLCELEKTMCVLHQRVRGEPWIHAIDRFPGNKKTKYVHTSRSISPEERLQYWSFQKKYKYNETHYIQAFPSLCFFLGVMATNRPRLRLPVSDIVQRGFV